MAGGKALSENWVPSIFEVDYGQQLGLSKQQVIACAEEMKDWALANANRQIARKADWSRAFKGWLRREAQKRGMFPTLNRRTAEEMRLSWNDIVTGLRESNGDRSPDQTDLFAASDKP